MFSSEIYFGQISVDQLRASCRARNARFDVLGALVFQHATHLNTDTLPFTRLFRGITQLLRNDNRRHALDRLCSRAQNIAFTDIFELFTAVRFGDAPLFTDLARYLKIIASRDDIVKSLGSYEYDWATSSHSVTYRQRVHIYAQVAYHMLNGWVICGHYDRLMTMSTDTTLRMIHDLYYFNSWPTLLHREACYTFLSRLQITISIGRMTSLAFRQFVPILINRRIRFQFHDDDANCNSMKDDIKHLVARNGSRIYSGWISVLRRWMPYALCAPVAPFVSGLIANRIISYLSNPRTDVREVIVAAADD